MTLNLHAHLSAIILSLNLKVFPKKIRKVFPGKSFKKQVTFNPPWNMDRDLNHQFDVSNNLNLEKI